jgi:hypothetical protein
MGMTEPRLPSHAPASNGSRTKTSHEGHEAAANSRWGPRLGRAVPGGSRGLTGDEQQVLVPGTGPLLAYAPVHTTNGLMP